MLSLRPAGLLSLRLSQLARPFLFLTLLRLVDVDAATRFVHYLGIFVILLETYNIFYPTDRLYLPDSRRVDLKFIVYRRMVISLLVSPIAFLFCLLVSKMNIGDALAIALLTFIGSISASFLSFAYPRSRVKDILTSEIVSILIFTLSFCIYVFTGDVLLGFLVYYSEQIAKAAYLSLRQRLRIIRTILLSTQVRYRNRANLSGIGEGMAVTISNQIFRLPFAFFADRLDPIYFVAAQMPSALYNLLIAIRTSIRIDLKPGYYIALAALGFAALWLIGAFLPENLHIPANLLVLCGFAAIHGAQLIHVPGRSGLASDSSARAMLIGGMLLVALCGLMLDVRLFLLAPLVLSIVGISFAHRHALR